MFSVYVDQLSAFHDDPMKHYTILIDFVFVLSILCVLLSMRVLLHADIGVYNSFC